MYLLSMYVFHLLQAKWGTTNDCGSYLFCFFFWGVPWTWVFIPYIFTWKFSKASETAPTCYNNILQFIREYIGECNPALMRGTKWLISTDQFRLLGVHSHYHILTTIGQQVTDPCIWNGEFLYTPIVLVRTKLLLNP